MHCISLISTVKLTLPCLTSSHTLSLPFSFSTGRIRLALIGNHLTFVCGGC